MASETAFPKMTQIGLGSVAQRCKLIDNINLKLTDVDRQFLQVRTDDAGKVKDQNIVRYMFLEAICRIGFIRFYNYGKGECGTRSEALQRTIEYMKEHWNTQNWEEWRW